MSYTIVHDNKLYFVDNGQVTCLEEHYKNEIQAYGQQLLDEVNTRHRVHDHTHDAARDINSDAAADLWFDSVNEVHPSPYYTRSPIIQGKPRDPAPSWPVWFIAIAFLFGLLIWWWK